MKLSKRLLIAGLFLIAASLPVWAALVTGVTITGKNISTAATLIPIPTTTVVALATAGVHSGNIVTADIFDSVFSTPNPTPGMDAYPERVTVSGISLSGAAITVVRASTPRPIYYSKTYNIWFNVVGTATPTFTSTSTFTPTATFTATNTPTVAPRSGLVKKMTTRAKVGTGAGWVVAGATDVETWTLPAGVTNGTLVVPVSGLNVGDTITGFYLTGQIESAGNSVTINADMRKLTAVAADITDASIGAITELIVVADTVVSSANSTKTLAAAETLAEGETIYILLNCTTPASTDIALQGINVVYTQN